MAARGVTQPVDRMRRILHYRLAAKRVWIATAILSCTTTRYRAAVSKRYPRAAPREILNINVYKSILSLSRHWKNGKRGKFLYVLIHESHDITEVPCFTIQLKTVPSSRYFVARVDFWLSGLR